MQRHQRGDARGYSSATEPGRSQPRDITSTIGPGRSTGSRELDPPPSQVRSTQWRTGGPTLAYRCGGSTGLGSAVSGQFAVCRCLSCQLATANRRFAAPVSRLTRRERSRSGTRYRVQADSRSRKARRPHGPIVSSASVLHNPGAAAPQPAPRSRARVNSTRPQALKRRFPGLWQSPPPATLHDTGKARKSLRTLMPNNIQKWLLTVDLTGFLKL